MTNSAKVLIPELISKIVSMVSIFAFSVLFGVAPLFCKKCVKSKKVQWINNAIICFSGGTLIGISFLHLMPEMRQSVERLKAKGHFTSFPVQVSLADTVICCGFFFIYVLDELIHLLLEYVGADHYHQPHGLRDSDETFNFVQTADSPKTKGSKDTKDEATSTDDGEIGPSLTRDIVAHSHPRIHIPSILTIVALSFHDVFEGLALGVQEDVLDVMFLFLSIATHKYAIAFSVSLDLLLSGVTDKMIFFYTLGFSLVNPIGIGIGIASDLISREEKIQSPMTVLMQGVASGSLIYVTCFEVLQRHTSSGGHVSGIRNTMFVIVGFIFILCHIIMTFSLCIMMNIETLETSTDRRDKTKASVKSNISRSIQ